MTSMEVDVPQVTNGFSNSQSAGSKKTVHFGPTSTRMAAADVTMVFGSSAEVRPKHKARRRARHPSKSDDVEEVTPKPISPTKLKKMSEKDRHSRTGVRGLPKKGENFLFFLVEWLFHLYSP